MKIDSNKIKKILLSHGLKEEYVNLALSAKKFSMTNPNKDWHTMRKKYEDIVNISLCIRMYEEEKVPIYKLAMAYGISDVALREHMIKHGVLLRGHACGINSQNSYFENIDTKDKAYFLGLLAADGSVVYNQKSYSISLELLEEDGYIIERFNQYAHLNEKIHLDARNNCRRKRIDIASKKMAKDLSKYGIVRDKSHKNSIFIPIIGTNLIPHFIRGYFDGDGIAKTNGYIGFCGSKTIIEQINDYFIELYNVSQNSITYNKWNGIYYIQWGKKEDTMKIADVIYKDSTDLFLKRKQEKIFNRLRPEVWKHTDLNLSKPTNIGCPI